jgi:peptide/nickel transport system ATP-binding protein
MPYTWGLLSSVPVVSSDPEARLIPIPGNPPSLLDPPNGCPFHPRCTHRDKVPGDLCRTELPPLIPYSRPDHVKRCHLANPDAIYEVEILPEIAPDLAEIVLDESERDAIPAGTSAIPDDREAAPGTATDAGADTTGPGTTGAGTEPGSVAPENR